MYKLISARGVRKGINQRWADIGPLDWVVSDLFSLFRRVVLCVNMGTDTTPLYLDLMNLADRYADYPKRLGDMLIDNGESALPTTPTPPVLQARFARFTNAHYHNYRINAWDARYADNNPIATRNDALITRTNPPTDYEFFARRSLVSVNGYYHAISNYADKGILVYDAMKSVRKCGQNSVGILYFGDIGKITTLKITDEMLLTRRTQDEIDNNITPPFSVSGYIKVGQDLTNKKVFLVMGGYLIDPTMGVLNLVNDDELEIKFSDYPLLNRYFESKPYLDLASLGLSSTPKNPDQISVQELYSDAVLKNYLKLTQSFLVILDAADVFTNRYPVLSVQPSIYRAYREPVYPLVLADGRMPEYWPRKDKTFFGSTWQITLHDSARHQRVYETIASRGQWSLGSSELSRDPVVTSGAYLLEIGSDEKLPY